MSALTPKLLPGGWSRIKPYLVLMRPHHYVKNFLIILPVFFSGALFQKEDIAVLILGFGALSLLSSFVYIINDICDLEKDRQHEKKRRRPLPAGQIKIKSAKGFSLVILSLAVTLSLGAAESGGWRSLVFFYLYLFINLFYSFKFKHYPIVDVALIAFGFVIRVLYGAELTEINISGWLYLTVLSASFYMGFGKRRNELLKSGSEKSRKVLASYNYNFLDKNMYVCLSMSMVFYSLWALNAAERLLVWTVPLVLLIFFRYSLLVEGETDGDPTSLLFSDRALMILVAIYIVALTALMYGPKLS